MKSRRQPIEYRLTVPYQYNLRNSDTAITYCYKYILETLELNGLNLKGDMTETELVSLPQGKKMLGQGNRRVSGKGQRTGGTFSQQKSDTAFRSTVFG